MRWSAGSPAGHSARKRSKSRWRQITPLDRSMLPPARSPFSRSSTRAPSSAACAAAARPPIPAPATIRSARPRRARNSGLCSTYSSWMPSGPHTKNANVFAASRTSAISMPRSRASSRCSWPESTSSAMWFSSGRSVLAVAPATRRRCLSPTASRSSASGSRPSAARPSLARAGSGTRSTTWSMSYSTSVPVASTRPMPRLSGASKVASLALAFDRAARAAGRRARGRGPTRAARPAPGRRGRAGPRPRTASACRGAHPTPRG